MRANCLFTDHLDHYIAVLPNKLSPRRHDDESFVPSRIPQILSTLLWFVVGTARLVEYIIRLKGRSCI